MGEVMPLLLVALIIWAGVFAFIMALDGRVRKLERKVDDARAASGHTPTTATVAAHKELEQ